MTGQWAADPYQRAELRYWDGAQWTHHISNHGLASVESIAPSPAYRPYNTVVTGAPGTSGMLIAAGVMTIIESAIMIIFGLWMFSLTNSSIGGLADDLTGGALTLIALVTTAIGATLLVSGIGACQGRQWARITVIVLHAIVGVLTLIGTISAATGDPVRRFDGTTESSPVGGLIFCLLWFATIILLAALAKPANLPTPNISGGLPTATTPTSSYFGPPQL